MKKLLIILLTFTAYTSSAQVYQRDPAYGRSIDRYEVLKDLGIPTFCGTPEVNSTVTNKAKIAYDSCGHLLYKYDPSTGVWGTVSGSDLSNYYSKTQIDSIFSLIGVYNQDGLISGGIVSWTGSGLSFNVSASEFRKFGIIYTTPDTTITLDAADVTYSRIDLFALDTTNGGEVIKITGTPAPTPVAPQVLDYQIALTTGITLNVGDTVPANVSIQKIYDENIEWATAASGEVTANLNDVSNPYTGSKDALVSSYGNIARLQFTRSGTGVMDGSEVLKMHISLRDTLKAGRYIRVLFLNNSTPLSSSIVPITKNNGLDPNVVNQYQTIQMPASVFQFTSTTYNRLIIYATGYDTSGTGGFYLDDVELQSGINNVPSQTDISGKVNYTDSGKIYVTPTQLAALHNNLNLYWPLYGDNADTSVHFKNDSLPRLDYATAVRDTSEWNDNTLIDKLFLHDRLAEVTSTGITRTELQDTASAIRNSIGPSGVSQSVISDTLKNYANSGSISTDNVVFSTPVALSVSNHFLSGTFALKSQSAYTLFGRGSGSGSPSFFASIDSNWVPSLHSEAYYNTKYNLPAQSGNSGKFLTTNGTNPSWGNLTGWVTTGNNVLSTDFIGTNNNFPVNIKTNGQYTAAFDVGGRFRIINPGAATAYLTAISEGGLGIGSSTGASNGSLAVGAITLSTSAASNLVIESTTNIASLSLNGQTDNYIKFSQRAAANRGAIGYAQNSNDLQIRVNGASSLTTGTQALRIFGATQNVSIGSNTTDDPTAAFMVSSTTEGALIPRMTKTQRNAIVSPAAGLMVIVTGETGGEYLSWYNSSTSGWVKVTSTAD